MLIKALFIKAIINSLFKGFNSLVILKSTNDFINLNVYINLINNIVLYIIN
jgi:hypothetical protein